MLFTPLAASPESIHAISDTNRLERMDRLAGECWTSAGVEVRWLAEHSANCACGKIVVIAPDAKISRLLLRWPAKFPDETLFLGDAWERSYGDLQWRHRQPDRIMPWYYLAHNSEKQRTLGMGVETQAHAFCFWQTDDSGVSLWIDLRNGGGPAHLGKRELHAATVIVAEYNEMSAFSAATRYCRLLCPLPRIAPHPICGNNNWYYAYGENFDAAAIRRDARFLAEIADGHANRPYCVIDAGWTPGGVNPGGPWEQSDPIRFPDMAELARDISSMGVNPGIWIRFSALRAGAQSGAQLRSGPQPAPEQALDLSDLRNLDIIAGDVARLREWGYRLLKHDFSTFDCFGRFGFDMNAELTDSGWHWADRTLTNAEVILNFYKLIREHARDMIIIGCNTVGHLAAGLVELQRTGDDTSGKCWERTRRMGINTLAFRLPQHGAFFGIDADCVAHTAQTPWEKDRQFLDLIARSGTSLFISTDPALVTETQKKEFRAAMQNALSGRRAGDCEPLDWLATTSPRRWRINDEIVAYNWAEASGTWPFSC